MNTAEKIFILQMIVFICIPFLVYFMAKTQLNKEGWANFKIKNCIQLSIIIGCASLLSMLLLYVIRLKSPEKALVFWIVDGLLFSLLYLIAGLYFIHKSGQSFSNILFNTTYIKSNSRFILKSFIITTALFFLISYIKYHTSMLDPTIIEKELRLFRYNWIFMCVDIVDSAILGPLGEELFFRGIIYNTLRPIGSKVAAILSSLMWALIHPFSVVRYIEIILFGIFLAYTYNRTKSLTVPIGIHSIQNLSVDLGRLTKYYNLI